MTSAEDSRFFFPAWGLSLILHGVVVGLAFACVSQAKPALEDDGFQWDVALVDKARPDSKSESVTSTVAPEQPPAKNASPSQVTRVSEISQTVVPIERTIVPSQPTVESVQPMDQKREAPQLREEPLEQGSVEVAAPKVEPALDSKESKPVAVAGMQEPVQAQAVQREAVAGSSVSTFSPEVPPAQEASVQRSSSTGGVEAPAMQMAKAPASDHRWLAESLWRRVAELKRYPNSARMNGQEGKVILKAVIRSDGHLVDVSVQKSFGYHVLDEAAIEAVKLACPLHMKHAIGKPQIVVSLPIVYSLAH